MPAKQGQQTRVLRFEPFREEANERGTGAARRCGILCLEETDKAAIAILDAIIDCEKQEKKDAYASGRKDVVRVVKHTHSDVRRAGPEEIEVLVALASDDADLDPTRAQSAPSPDAPAPTLSEPL